MTKYKFIEVCAGCGGLSTGFINKGFEAIMLNEIDETCCETLKLNHPNIAIECKSMTDISYDKYKDIDVIMGGVPCQSFSLAGKRKGLKDERGDLILQFAKIVKKIQPKCFLIENVKGLKHHEKGKTLELILKKLNYKNLYDISYSVLNANDYGVAQNRERLIIIGFQKKLNIDYAFPEKEKTKLVLKDVISNCPNTEDAKYNDAKKKIMALVPEGGCWVDLPLDIQKKYMGKSFNSGGGKRGIAKRLSMNKPSLTLLTTPSQKQTERCHPKYNRPLNLIEYSRIQSFPDSYKFAGTISKKYKQIGNAVPVKLAEALAKSIEKALNKSSSN